MNNQRHHLDDGIVWRLMPWLLWAVVACGSAASFYYDETVYQIFLSGQPQMIDVLAVFIWLSLLGLIVFGVTKFFFIRRPLKRKLLTVTGMVPALVMLWLFGGASVQPVTRSVCSDDGSCYHLTVAPVPTDTIYEIWTSGDAWLDRLRRSDALSRRVSYSEDGSYTENPMLVMSGDARFLAVNRGGQFLDLIDLTPAKADTGFGRECCWQNSKDEVEANSKRIAALLELHSG